MTQVIVIGAGISGLTAAYALRKSGHDVMVFDECGEPGGRMRSERSGGFLVEYGANTIVYPAPAAQGLIAQLGLDGEKVFRQPAARHRYLVRGGRARHLPTAPHRYLTSDFFSPGGRLRMLMELFVPPRVEDETIAAFVRRRFGAEVLDYVVDPLVAGLYAGDPGHLSVSAIFPRLKELEHSGGSVIAGALKSRFGNGAKAGGGPAKRVLGTFCEGLGTLPRALARELSGRIFCGHRVETLRRGAGGGYRVKLQHGGIAQWTVADSVIVALPAYAAAGVISGLDNRVADGLAQISHPPVAIVFLGYGRRAIAHPLDGVGVLTPAREARQTLGMLFSSTLFAGRAPPEHVALTTFIGGARQPQLAALESRALVELAHAEARDLLGARAAPAFARVHRWPHGLPQPGMEHAQRLAAIGGAAHDGLFLTGNYFSGVSTAACMQQALDTAESVARHLARRTSRRRFVA